MHEKEEVRKSPTNGEEIEVRSRGFIYILISNL